MNQSGRLSTMLLGKVLVEKNEFKRVHGDARHAPGVTDQTKCGCASRVEGLVLVQVVLYA